MGRRCYSSGWAVAGSPAATACERPPAAGLVSGWAPRASGLRDRCRPHVRPHEFAARRQLRTRSAGEASPPQRTPPRGLRRGRGLGLDGATLRGVSGKRLAVYRAPEDLGLWTKASWTNGPVMLFWFVFLTGWTDTTVCPLTHLTLSSVPGQFKNGVELGRSRCAPCGAPCMR